MIIRKNTSIILKNSYITLLIKNKVSVCWPKMKQYNRQSRRRILIILFFEIISTVELDTALDFTLVLLISTVGSLH